MHSVKKVAVTGGAGQIAYNLLFRIASGELLGPDQPLELRVLEVPDAKKALDGVVMELEDCAYPLLRGIHPCIDARDGFEGADLAILIGAKPRGPGMERGDLLKENAKIFISQGGALNEKASPECLVFVVGNPCNTNALITAKHAPKLDKRRIFSMTRLDENRAKAQIAKRAKVGVSTVKQMAIWGNHSATQVPDFFHATIQGKPVIEVIKEKEWLEGEFIEMVQKRGAKVIDARGTSSAASAANAVLDSIHSLLTPTPSNDWFSLGVYSNGNPYGVDEDLFFSFPCRSKGDGLIEIVKDLDWDPFLREKIMLTEKELIDERLAL